MSKTPLFWYVGVKPCGCVPFACADEPRMGRDIADAVKRGLALERVPVAQARERFAYKCGVHQSLHKPVAAACLLARKQMEREEGQGQ